MQAQTQDLKPRTPDLHLQPPVQSGRPCLPLALGRRDARPLAGELARQTRSTWRGGRGQQPRGAVDFLTPHGQEDQARRRPALDSGDSAPDRAVGADG
jgi:hypothetical protein